MRRRADLLDGGGWAVGGDIVEGEGGWLVGWSGGWCDCSRFEVRQGGGEVRWLVTLGSSMVIRFKRGGGGGGVARMAVADERRKVPFMPRVEEMGWVG